MTYLDASHVTDKIDVSFGHYEVKHELCTAQGKEEKKAFLVTIISERFLLVAVVFSSSRYSNCVEKVKVDGKYSQSKKEWKYDLAPEA